MEHLFAAVDIEAGNLALEDAGLGDLELSLRTQRRLKRQSNANARPNQPTPTQPKANVDVRGSTRRGRKRRAVVVGDGERHETRGRVETAKTRNGPDRAKDKNSRTPNKVRIKPRGEGSHTVEVATPEKYIGNSRDKPETLKRRRVKLVAQAAQKNSQGLEAQKKRKAVAETTSSETDSDSSESSSDGKSVIAEDSDMRKMAQEKDKTAASGKTKVPTDRLKANKAEVQNVAVVSTQKGGDKAKIRARKLDKADKRDDGLNTDKANALSRDENRFDRTKGPGLSSETSDVNLQANTQITVATESVPQRKSKVTTSSGPASLVTQTRDGLINLTAKLDGGIQQNTSSKSKEGPTQTSSEKDSATGDLSVETSCQKLTKTSPSSIGRIDGWFQLDLDIYGASPMSTDKSVGDLRFEDTQRTRDFPPVAESGDAVVMSRTQGIPIPPDTTNFCSIKGCSQLIAGYDKCSEHLKSCSITNCTAYALPKFKLCAEHYEATNICEKRGCTSQKVAGPGQTRYCMKHGVANVCFEDACTGIAKYPSRYCKEHIECTVKGCESRRAGKTRVCRKHGGGKVCAEIGCTTRVVHPAQRCEEHPALPRVCKMEGCGKRRAGKSFCVGHGGGKRCMKDGCKKLAQGPTNFCCAHGGRRVCFQKGCTNPSVPRSRACKEHGGGQVCKYEYCIASIRVGTEFCKTHGVTRRCVVEGCGQVVRSFHDFCKNHGFGRLCSVENCKKRAEPNLCLEHGGRERCTFAGCKNRQKRGQVFCPTHCDGKVCRQEGCCKTVQGAAELCALHLFLKN